MVKTALFCMTMAFADVEDVSTLLQVSARRNPTVDAKKAEKDVAKEDKEMAKRAKNEAKDEKKEAEKLWKEDPTESARLNLEKKEEALSAARKKLEAKKATLEEKKADLETVRELLPVIEPPVRELPPFPPLTMDDIDMVYAEYGSPAGSCTMKYKTAVSGNYLTDGGNETFNKYENHTKTDFTHKYTTVSECSEKCLAIPSCAGFVDNRDAEPKYCVFKEAMVTYSNEAKDSWSCSASVQPELMTATVDFPEDWDWTGTVVGVDGAGAYHGQHS